MENSGKGLILINLGSPESPAVADVKNYLKEFLMDKRVIDIPYIFRTMLVKGIIAPFRSPRSAEAYKAIWTENGSPLKAITKKFSAELAPKINMPVTYCMRYGNPNPADAVRELENKIPQLNEILIAPMYPHYAMSSYETAAEHVKKYINSHRRNIKIKLLKPFYDEPGYIEALAATIRPHIEKEQFDAYLFSYHGLPVRHLKKSDPTENHCYMQNDCCQVKSEQAWSKCYKHQVTVATQLVAQKLALPAEKVIQSFQSRLGKGWIEPYTDKLLEEFPARNIKKLLVISPSFVADCLETLEEVNIQGRKTFMENGGEEFVSVPCLNVSPKWVDIFASYCNGHEDEYSKLWN